MPAKNRLALEQLLGYEPFAKEGKLAYSNSTPQCLARLVALFRSTQERDFASLFQLSTPGSLSVRDATIPAMSA